MADIAFDVFTNGGNVNPGTSLTWSHTCSAGDKRFLIVFMRGGNGEGDKVTGVTYNGISMTKLASTVTVPTANQVISGYYLANPASGAHNVVISLSSGYLAAASMSYTGVKQSGLPDSINTGTANAVSLTLSTTTVANNCWTVAAIHRETATVSAGTGTTERGHIGGFADFIGCDSNGALTPPGSKSLQGTATSGDWGGIIISLPPFTVSGFFGLL